VVFASSGCVYPNFLQSDTKKELYLTEDLTKGPNDADNTYGWAKLMGEFTLQAYAKEHGMGAASCRYFTVYGPRGVENHAVIAMIARAFLGRTLSKCGATAHKSATGHTLKTSSKARFWPERKLTTARRLISEPWNVSALSIAPKWCANSPDTKPRSSSARICPQAAQSRR